MELLLFNLAYLLSCCANCLILKRLLTTKSMYGLSVDTQISFVLATLSRCVWTLYTRLIETNLAYFELISSVVLSLCILFLCAVKYNDPTNPKVPIYLKTYFLAPIALALGFIFHPGTAWWSMQVLVAFTMNLEAFGLLPQLYLLRKIVYVEPVAGSYILLLGLARIVRFGFWMKLYTTGDHFVELIVADVFHTLCCVDFAVMWFRKLKSSGAFGDVTGHHKSQGGIMEVVAHPLYNVGEQLLFIAIGKKPSNSGNEEVDSRMYANNETMMQSNNMPQHQGYEMSHGQQQQQWGVPQQQPAVAQWGGHQQQQQFTAGHQEVQWTNTGGNQGGMYF